MMFFDELAPLLIGVISSRAKGSAGDGVSSCGWLFVGEWLLVFGIYRLVLLMVVNVCSVVERVRQKNICGFSVLISGILLIVFLIGLVSLTGRHLC